MTDRSCQWHERRRANARELPQATGPGPGGDFDVRMRIAGDGGDARLRGDLDICGWPQSGRGGRDLLHPLRVGAIAEGGGDAGDCGLAQPVAGVPDHEAGAVIQRIAIGVIADRGSLHRQRRMRTRGCR